VASISGRRENEKAPPQDQRCPSKWKSIKLSSSLVEGGMFRQGWLVPGTPHTLQLRSMVCKSGAKVIECK